MPLCSRDQKLGRLAANTLFWSEELHYHPRGGPGHIWTPHFPLRGALFLALLMPDTIHRLRWAWLSPHLLPKSQLLQFIHSKWEAPYLAGSMFPSFFLGGWPSFSEAPVSSAVGWGPLQPSRGESQSCLLWLCCTGEGGVRCYSKGNTIL